MPRIHYLTEGRTIEIGSDTTLLRASLDHGIAHTHVCGGNAKCSTCRVLVIEGLGHCCPRNEREARLAGDRRFSADIRLACQTTVSGDVTLRRLVLDAEDILLVDAEARGAAVGSAGEERQVAILFSDIRNFTAFSEAQLPYDVVHALNRYFNRVGAVVTRHGGQIDNFIGDGMMALFGATAESANPSLDAVRAALDMQAEVAAMRAYFDAQYKFDLRIGIGIHYGEVVLGAVGFGERRRLTAIGDAVNLASRIESMNKEAGTTLLISGSAWEQVRDAARCGRVLEVPLKGKSGKYPLYEITALAGAGAQQSPKTST
jgi:adenylate cyclase